MVKNAGFFHRIIPYFIDGIILIVIVSLIKFSFAWFFWIVDLEPFNMRSFSILGTSVEPFHILLGWVYFAGFESSNRQATIGKSMLKLKVADLDDNKISFLKATSRYIIKFIEITSVIGWIGIFYTQFNEKRRTWHDYIAGTQVFWTDQ